MPGHHYFRQMSDPYKEDRAEGFTALPGSSSVDFEGLAECEEKDYKCVAGGAKTEGACYQVNRMIWIFLTAKGQKSL